MNSQGLKQDVAFKAKITDTALNFWNSLGNRQKAIAKKVFGIITYKWRWQIAMNVPYLAIFLLDRTFPVVHRFDLMIISSITSKIPIPSFLSAWLNLGS